MADWLSPFRSSYRAMRVSRETGLEVERVGGVVTGGSVERNLDAAIKHTGSISLIGNLDVGSDLVRLYLDATSLETGEAWSEPLGTFVPSVTSRGLGGAVASQTVNLSGRLQELADEQFDGTYSLPAGTDPVAAAEEIVSGVGLEVVSDAHGSYLTSQTWTFDDSSDPSKLACVNQLLDMAGFSSADTDVAGRVAFSRWRSTSERSPSWSFVEGRNARFLRDVTDELDATDVANVVKVVFSSEDSVTVGLAENEEGRFGIAEVGRRKYKRYDYNQGATQEEADAKAAQLLEEQSALRRVTLKSVYGPYDIGDAVTVSYPSQGVSGTFGVRKLSRDLGAGCLTTVEVRSFG